MKLDTLDKETRDYLLQLLVENRKLKEALEREKESSLFWYQRCGELVATSTGGVSIKEGVEEWYTL